MCPNAAAVLHHSSPSRVVIPLHGPTMVSQCTMRVCKLLPAIPPYAALSLHEHHVFTSCCPRPKTDPQFLFDKLPLLILSSYRSGLHSCLATLAQHLFAKRLHGTYVGGSHDKCRDISHLIHHIWVVVFPLFSGNKGQQWQQTGSSLLPRLLNFAGLAPTCRHFSQK